MITTYAELQTAAANWLDRTDLTARIPEFIELAEANFNRKIQQIRMITKNDSFSIAVDLRITELVDGNVGVHVMVSKELSGWE